MKSLTQQCVMQMSRGAEENAAEFSYGAILMRSSGPLSERNEKCHNNHSCKDASLAFNDSLNYSYAVDAERASKRTSE